MSKKLSWEEITAQIKTEKQAKKVQEAILEYANKQVETITQQIREKIRQDHKEHPEEYIDPTTQAPYSQEALENRLDGMIEEYKPEKFFDANTGNQLAAGRLVVQQMAILRQKFERADLEFEDGLVNEIGRNDLQRDLINPIKTIEENMKTPEVTAMLDGIRQVMGEAVTVDSRLTTADVQSFMDMGTTVQQFFGNEKGYETVFTDVLENIANKVATNRTDIEIAEGHHYITEQFDQECKTFAQDFLNRVEAHEKEHQKDTAHPVAEGLREALVDYIRIKGESLTQGISMKGDPRFSTPGYGLLDSMIPQLNPDIFKQGNEDKLEAVLKEYPLDELLREGNEIQRLQNEYSRNEVSLQAEQREELERKIEEHELKLLTIAEDLHKKTLNATPEIISLFGSETYLKSKTGFVGKRGLERLIEEYMPARERARQREVRKARETYDIQNKVVMDGRSRFYDLMTNGVEVTDPINNTKVTLHNNKESNAFLNRIRTADPTYPMTEIGRDDCSAYHMYMFLYSKGFQPAELEELTVHPESEQSKKIADRIKEVRQEYFEIATSKDTDRIARMYADGYKNLQRQDMGWMSKVNTPQKMAEMLPKMEFFGGSQSVWFQTNQLGGGDPRPVDMELTGKVSKICAEENIALSQVVNAMQYMNTVKQYTDKSFRLFENASHRERLMAIGQLNAMLPANATLSEMATDKKISLDGTFQIQTSISDNAFDTAFSGNAYNKTIDSIILGEPDAFSPLIITEVSMEAATSGKDLATPSYLELLGKWWSEDSEIEEHIQNWKADMENAFRKGELIDGMSANYCVQMVKEGTYDALTGVKGDGELMLQVMHGDASRWDELSDLSKAAVITRMASEHPALFSGTVESMYQEAARLNLDLNNPVYDTMMNRVMKMAEPYTVTKMQTVKEMLAEDTLKKRVQNASAEDKKETIKTLFLLQLANAQPSDVMKNDGSITAMRMLASGGEITFRLPKTAEDPIELLPDGEEKLADGIYREFAYQDGNLVMTIGGTMGAGANPNRTEADLRCLEPGSLTHILSALDDKMEEMDEEELNQAISQLGGNIMSREQMASALGELGKSNGLPNVHQAFMGMAAKEVNPPYEFNQDDFETIDRIYNEPIRGERKYVTTIQSMEPYQEILAKEKRPVVKDYFTKYLEYYQETARQMQMYADAAEKMRIIKEENEKSIQPSANIRMFAQVKEREMAEKYSQMRQTFERLEAGLHQVAHDIGKAWVELDANSPELQKEVRENAGKKGPELRELEANFAWDFTAVDFEAKTEKTANTMAEHKWTLAGIKFDNSDRYQTIVDSLEVLSKMRGKAANADNMKEYEKELEHLRDLCEDYIVTHRNPLRQDGKDRLRMIKDIWEGMSNVNGKTMEDAMQHAKNDAKIGDMNLHSGERKKVSLSDLESRETERKARLKATKAMDKQRMETMKARREAEKAAQKNAGAGKSRGN